MSQDDPLIGTELGDFRPTRVIGKGGMGVVYEADDLALRRKVALKVLAPDFVEDTKARTRFQREIDHAVAIEHPHVVPVYSAGFERPHFYIAMRLIPGPDLAKVRRESGPLGEDRVMRLLGQIASALYAVHQRGLVHRDIKPANVLVWAGGTDDEHAMLTDFGIAKAIDDTQNVTGVGPVGTPGYMAPEVCLGQPATPASDQYSLGCLAYELLAGRPVFDGDSASVRQAHVEQKPVPLAEAAPACSSVVAAAVDKALAKSPDHRHNNVRELVRAAKAADQAFRRSEEITRVMTEAKAPADAVGRLSTDHGLSDATISQITDIDRTQVVRLRRRQVRRALVGRRPVDN